MEEKYINLLFSKCMKFTKSKALFINYEKSENEEFVNKIILKAQKLGVEDIYLNDEASRKKHSLLKTITLEEIKINPIFKSEKWDDYAKKNAAFLIIDSEIPGLMNDIDSEKIKLAKEISRNTKPVYKKMQMNNELSWCICAYPNETWAKNLFPNEKDAYLKLKNLILKMCMCDKKNPEKAWEDFLKTTKERANKLTNMKIKQLHYTNSLGTDLYLELPDNCQWSSAANENIIVNMPSYEVFTSPHKLKTNGTVYGSLPLFYNGIEIEGIFLEFKNGKVINFSAQKGQEILEGIINSDQFSCYLGECALVNHNSPIANTNCIYKTTLFDENASCHLALGAGFPECIKEYKKYSADELIKMGINYSNNHVDFMIGTDDLKIEAETSSGKCLIFKNGNFII